MSLQNYVSTSFVFTSCVGFNSRWDYLAQSVERETFNLVVESSNLSLGNSSLVYVDRILIPKNATRLRISDRSDAHLKKLLASALLVYVVVLTLVLLLYELLFLYFLCPFYR